VASCWSHREHDQLDVVRAVHRRTATSHRLRRQTQSPIPLSTALCLAVVHTAHLLHVWYGSVSHSSAPQPRRTCYERTNEHPFNGPLSGTTRVSRYQKGKTNVDFTEARDSDWQWHQLGHMQVCTSLLTDNHASTPPLSFLQAGCPSCRPTNSVKALKAQTLNKMSRS